jgi:ABC-type branched-subunit amino acid transport system substrate-binding protein
VVVAPNGENVGVNDGSYAPFDIGPQRADSNLKLQAAQALRNGDPQTAISRWHQCLQGPDTNDAEALIYIENQKAVAFNHITLIVGLDFQQPFPDTESQSPLQGAYIAQKEFNNAHRDIKLRLLIANTGGDLSYISPVAQQMARVARQDSTIVGVLGWQTSSRTKNVLDFWRQTGTNIPMVSQTTASDDLTGVSPYFFRIVPPDTVQTQTAVLMTNRLHATQAVILADPSNLYSQNFGQDFKQQFVLADPSHQILAEKRFTVGKTTPSDFSRLLHETLSNVRDTSHVVIFFASGYIHDSEQFQEALGDFPKLPVISGPNGYVAHKNSYGHWYFVSYAYHDEWFALMGNSPPSFFQEYDDAFDPTHQSLGDYGRGLPNDTAIVSYDAAKVLAQGIDIALLKGASNLTPQALTHALTLINQSHPWQGVSGQIVFGADHDPIDKALVVLKVSDDGHIQMVCVQGRFSNNSHSSLPNC